MGSRLASISELYLSDAPQIESAWRQWSDEQLNALLPTGYSLSDVKHRLENGEYVLLTDSPKSPLYTGQYNSISPPNNGDIPTAAVKQIHQRFASAGNGARLKASSGNLHPAVEPVYIPDPSVTKIAPEKPFVNSISPKFGQPRRQLQLSLTYNDAECTPAIEVPYRAEFSDGTIIEGSLDKQGKALLDRCPSGRPKITFGNQAAQAQAEQSLPLLYAQLESALDNMAVELAVQSEQVLVQAKASEKLPELKASLKTSIEEHFAQLRQQRDEFDAQPQLIRYWQIFQSSNTGAYRGIVEYIPDLGELGELMDAAGISLSALVEAIATGDIDELEQKLQQWQQRGETGLEIASEAMEMLILLLSDVETRELLSSLPERYLLALPPDKSAEIAFYFGSQTVADYGVVSAGSLVGTLAGGVTGPVACGALIGATAARKAGKTLEQTTSLLMDIARANKNRRNHHQEQHYIEKNQTPLEQEATPNYGYRAIDKDVEGKKDDGVHPAVVRMRPPVAVPCFKPRDSMIKKYPGSREDLERRYANQLKHQEKGLNDLTLAEYLENRQRYRDMKRGNAQLSQDQFRRKFKEKTSGSLYKSYQKKLTPAELKDDGLLTALEIRAEKRATEIMQDLAALHDPDTIAGGHTDNISRMGDNRINSSIGPQWRSRVKVLDAAMEKALQDYGPEAAQKIKLQVQLKRCPVN